MLNGHLRVKRRSSCPHYAQRDFAVLEQRLREQAAALQQQTQEFESIANNIAGGLQICDFNDSFTIHYVSDGFLSLVGYSREELIGSHHVALVYPDDVSLLICQVTRQLESKGEFSIVYRILHRSGELRWVLDKGNLFLSADGERRVQCFLTDITEQKLLEEEMRVSQKRYEIAMRQLDVSMFEYNLATKQLTLFEQDASLYGMTSVIENGPHTLASSGFFDDECVPDYLEMYRKVCSGEEREAGCRVTAHDVDGKLHEFELTLTSVLDELGRPIRAIGVKRNFSHLRRLQREQEFVRTMIAGRTFICEADITSDRILNINADWCRKLGIDTPDRYTETAALAVQLFGSAEQRNELLHKVSASHLISLLEQGQHLENFSFPLPGDTNGELIWSEASINIIRDEASGNVCVRIYHEDISERRRKESRAAEERRAYESMVGKAMVAYEVNISRNLALRGHENWNSQHGIRPTSSYSQMITEFALKGMVSQDSDRFAATFDREYLLRAYDEGEREFACQYRKRMSTAEHLWVECTLHLFEDPDNGEILGFSYVENIDRQKRAELELRYKAEHDALSGLFNKETTTELIAEFLESPEGRSGSHAFLMIDMDHFKDVNDLFGHLFGDSVIADAAVRIRELFREDDIIGRIGGDEFCILMKHVVNPALVRDRGERLCRTLTQHYGDDALGCTLSASVGIALFPLHGRSFNELYRNADVALYDAKRSGRSQYAICN